MLIKMSTQPKKEWDSVRKTNTDRHDTRGVTVILECEDSDEGRAALARAGSSMPIVLPEAVLVEHNRVFDADRQGVEVSSAYRKLNAEANTVKDNPNILFFTYAVRKQASISEELISAMFGSNTD